MEKTISSNRGNLIAHKFGKAIISTKQSEKLRNLKKHLQFILQKFKENDCLVPNDLYFIRSRNCLGELSLHSVTRKNNTTQ